MNFADNFTAADCRARVLHNTNAELFPMAVACIEAAVEMECREAGLEVSNIKAEADLLSAVLIDRGFMCGAHDAGDETDLRYHITVRW